MPCRQLLCNGSRPTQPSWSSPTPSHLAPGTASSPTATASWSRSRKGVNRNVIRSTFAVLAGYATMAVMVSGTTAALARLWSSSPEDEDQPTPAYTAMNLAYSSLFAATGGYVTSALSQRSPMGHAAALAVMVLVLGAVYPVQSTGGKQPDWYLALLPVLASGGVLTGGHVNSRSR